ncbi:hypothetical protein GCM10009663_63180 [Kitasatospora arboriphila]|uniref:Uncharacterized protein n=1 Tax=Kitasatospora arboriphila TaxID=258052 RepID=A0ABP4ENG5_9ACTN
MVCSRAASRWILRPLAFAAPRRLLPSHGQSTQSGGTGPLGAAVGEPAGHRPIQRVAVDPGQQAPHGRFRRQAPMRGQGIDAHADLFQHMRPGVGDPLADRQQRRRAGQHRASGQREDGDQGMAHSAWVAGVGHLCQALQQPGYLLGGGELQMLAELVKGRWDRR